MLNLDLNKITDFNTREVFRQLVASLSRNNTSTSGLAGATGPMGLTGPDGASGLIAFTFTQGTDSATWNIAHNLGYKPNASIYSVGGMHVDAEVLQVDNNNMIISFSNPFSGYARLI